MTEKIKQLIETYVNHENFKYMDVNIEDHRREMHLYFKDRPEAESEEVLNLWIENEDCTSDDPDEWDMDYEDEEEE